jgi:hypothetical protein
MPSGTSFLFRWPESNKSSSMSSFLGLGSSDSPRLDPDQAPVTAK